MLKTRCYYCGDLSHLVWKCLVRMNIRQLTVKQQEELMKDLNVLKDVKNLQQHELKEANPLDNKYELLKQDFVTRAHKLLVALHW